MIAIIGPAGFEHFSHEPAEMLADEPPQPEDAAPALAAEYGGAFGRPAWLPDVIARFGLTPPPGVRPAPAPPSSTGGRGARGIGAGHGAGGGRVRG
ncbi:hypothetical protein [Kitasatospora griseola]|uniref:hypothetical protein n=1 Tax=Kitasatospora griseola TaxID=2064 RepID=UPI00166FAF64|nr:hypothetical protein [Kitasatospora griseola]GGQ80150.1 hypothetical protein GCM10010195_39780 [Kitasatospora griseola]